VSIHAHTKNRRAIKEQSLQSTKHFATLAHFQQKCLPLESILFQHSSMHSVSTSTIQVQSKVAFDEDIEVTFNYCSATEKTLIGIFLSTADTSNHPPEL